MNFITVLSDETPEMSSAFIASLMKYGGGQDGDTLVILSSKLSCERTRDYVIECGQFFDKVDHVCVHPCGFLGYTADTFSEIVMGHTMFRRTTPGLCCFFPMGTVPSQEDWAKTIRNEYHQSNKEFMGYTHPLGGESTASYIKGPFVMDGYNFRVIPFFKGYHRSGTCIKRSIGHTTRSCHHFHMPFRKFDVPEEKTEEIKQIESDKIEKIPTKTPGSVDEKYVTKKPAAKKAAKKTAKKRAPRKPAAKKVAKKVISEKLADSVSPEEKTDNS